MGIFDKFIILFVAAGSVLVISSTIMVVFCIVVLIHSYGLSDAVLYLLGIAKITTIHLTVH